MRSRRVVAVGAVLAILAGCGPGATPVSPSCTDSPRTLFAALRRAPGRVALPDGSRLSQCISNGTGDGELQDVGLAFHQAAEALRVRARTARDDAAALQLGYLVGATRRGAAHTGGVMAELQRRVELVAGRLEEEAPARAAAVQRGLAAGERDG